LSHATAYSQTFYKSNKTDTKFLAGWSTGVVPALTNYVLGVIPTGPGFSTFSVKPIPGDVEWAKGKVSTPKGQITVSWSNNPEFGLFFLGVNSPPGSSATLTVPVANSSFIVFVNSAPAWEDRASKAYDAQYMDNGYISVEVVGGDHNVTVSEA
jgi:hypothetical protein